MKNLSCLAIFLLCFSFAHPGRSNDEKIYSSSGGFRLYLKTGVKLPDKFILYRISSKTQEKQLLNILDKIIDKDDWNTFAGYSCLLALFEARDYTKEYFYILLSSPTKKFHISDPYHFQDSKDLIFDVDEQDKKPKKFLYTRTYIIDKAEDIFEKYINIGSNKIKVSPVEL